MKNAADFIGTDDLVYEIHKTKKQWFPDWTEWMSEVPDYRTAYTYSAGSLLDQGVFMFLLKEQSRNMVNIKAEHGRCYKENFSKLFDGSELAHFDTADDFYQSLHMEDVEKVKTKMVKSLIEKKRLPTFRGRYLVAIDGTGITSYDKEPADGDVIHKTSNKGVTTYLNSMLEAKIVTPEGLSISMASEPLRNKGKEKYDKQDCELSAFKRIVAKIKKNFPRLPICLLLDGLYSNAPVFECCEQNGWEYITVLKDGSLKLLQEDIVDTEESKRLRFTHTVCIKKKREVVYADSSYQCIEGLQHDGHIFNCIEGVIPKPRVREGEEVEMNRFVILTNISMDNNRGESKRIFIRKIVDAGRLRWKIENEGFNTQKNQGYQLQHKFSRKSIETLQVYYILLQIAHIINQIVAHSKPVAMLIERSPRLTMKYLWDRLRHCLEDYFLDTDLLNLNKRRCQIRLVKVNRLE